MLGGRWLIGWLVVSFASSSIAAPPTTQAIDQSIRKGTAWLYEQQKPDGHWERNAQRVGDNHDWGNCQGDTWGGNSAMAVYALLSIGEKPTDPKLAAAIAWLKKSDQVGVYNLGVRCATWALLPPAPDVRELLRRDAALLLKSTKTDPAVKGLHHYTSVASGGEADMSVSQFAVLGLWAAAQAGVEVPTQYWTIADAAWRKEQYPEGGWAYWRLSPEAAARQPRGPITNAGIATLFITQSMLVGTNANCRGNLTDPNVERAITFVEKHFDATMAGGGTGIENSYYSLFGIERVGVASGYKYFGQIDWFARIAERLVTRQHADGHWGSGDPYDVTNTSFALIALARARAPVMINKLRYDSGGHWNQRPRDVANVVHWTGRQVEANLNWQIVPLEAPVQELLDAPVLYIAGDTAPNFTAEQQDKLRQFMHGGGLILGNADCGAARFATAFQKLGRDLFPDYKWRELPADHVIYTRQQFPRGKWKTKPSVLALSNGVREVMVLIPTADAGKWWQLQAGKSKEELFQLASNVMLYADGAERVRSMKGQTHLVAADPAIKPEREVVVARIKYDGNWDPEPGAWPRLASLVLNERKVALKAVTVSPDALTPIATPFAHLTGTGKFTLSGGQRDAIRTFVETGGTLIVDAAGGSGEFAIAAEAELAAIFPDSAKALQSPLPPDSPLYSGDGKPLQFGYRDFARGALTGQMNQPRIRGMEVGRKLRVYFSREDLTAGLMGQRVDGIIGYDPPTAAALMCRMLNLR